MKKIFSVLVIFSLVMFMMPVGANAAGTNWDIRGTYVWNVFGVYFHDFVIDVQNPDGTFTGHASYPAVGYPLVGGTGLTTETVTGTVDGDNISFRVVYLGPFAPGSTFDMTGTITSDGTISGTSPWVWSLDGHKATKDTDGDGVLDGQDFCLSTTPDTGSWSVSIGTNRLQYMNDGIHLSGWYQNKPAGKGTTALVKVQDLSYTYGCSGQQILKMLNEKFGSVMNGHLKYGLSSSVIEDFHKDLNDGILDGQYYLETVKVTANGTSPVSSTGVLLSGHNYVLKASGTAFACNEPGCVIKFDASYSTSDNSTWVDGVAAPYDSYGQTLLDLQVNGSSINWGVYSPSHSYSYDFVGLGSPVSFQIYDVYYPNNTGNLTVEIYGKI